MILPRFRMSMAAAVLALALTAARTAAENYRLETNVYVFKDSEFPAVDHPAAATGEVERIIISSFDTLRLGAATLVLDGATYSWNSDGPIPGITHIRMPQAITRFGQPVKLLSGAPVQYLEKQPDGSFRIRDIPADSAEAPHCRLGFRLEAFDHGDVRMRVDCEVSLATVARRETIPGVTLDVGRPVLAHFEDRHELSVHLGEWTAWLVRAPNAGAYSLLVLLKVSPETATTSSDRLMSPEQLAEFFTHYYKRPQPERISHALASVGPAGILDRQNFHSVTYRQAEYYCIGFFAEVFAAHPEQVPGWRQLVERSDVRYWLNKVFQVPREDGVLKATNRISWHQEVSLYWGAFSASGNRAYLRKLIGRLSLVDVLNEEQFRAGVHAMDMLGSHARTHPLVREALVEARPDADPRTRELIDQLLNDGFNSIMAELEKRRPLPKIPFWPQRAPRNYAP